MCILHPAIIENLYMKIIDKIIESISNCLSLIFKKTLYTSYAIHKLITILPITTKCVTLSLI